MSYRNKTARQKNFAIVPSADIPRSRFPMRQTRKMAFDASDLIPIYCEEVLPGDTWSHNEAIMARFATPIAPAVDDIQLETFYFFVPNRIHNEDDWEGLITGTETIQMAAIGPPDTEPGEAYVIPVGSVLDHFGLPPGTYTQRPVFTALPFWCYFKIYNDWFRDQNLQEEWDYSTTYNTSHYTNAITQGATTWNMMPLRSNKRSDYFTRSLPWPQKGQPVTLPLGSQAPVVQNSLQPIPTFRGEDGTTWPGPDIDTELWVKNASDGVFTSGTTGTTGGNKKLYWAPGSTATGLVADLSQATAATINAIRMAFQTQKLLERDARGGSRYVEQLLAHFRVRSPDFRLQRPEYLGGNTIPVNVNPIAQTAAYDAEPADSASPVGNLGAEMHARGSKHTFNYAATEHGYIIGLATVRATPTYQQGVRRHWIKRQTRLDFYFPVFSHLGEQAVDTREIYYPLDGTPDTPTWGYQERNAEMRYTPNEITGVLRSTVAQPMDWWHYAEEFANEPALNGAFITDKTKETLARSLATAPSAQWSAQIIMDILHDASVARLMPAYATPGLIDHF